MEFQGKLNIDAQTAFYIYQYFERCIRDREDFYMALKGDKGIRLNLSIENPRAFIQEHLLKSSFHGMIAQEKGTEK